MSHLVVSEYCDGPIRDDFCLRMQKNLYKTKRSFWNTVTGTGDNSQQINKKPKHSKAFSLLSSEINLVNLIVKTDIYAVKKV